MSYDLAFWEGPPPRDHEEALARYEEIWDDLDDIEETIPPTPAIQALIVELESRWPATDTNAPWAMFPLGGQDAQGGTLYVNLVSAAPDEYIEFMAAAARRLGLVCFDPQVHRVL